MIEGSIVERITNASLLTDIFGYWPSFHDAEILSVRLERNGDTPFLEAMIWAFQTADQLTDDGHFLLKNEVFVTLRFTDIELHRLDSFNQQNVISELSIELAVDSPRQFLVTISSSFGCDGEFDCNAIEVVKVENGSA